MEGYTFSPPSTFLPSPTFPLHTSSFNSLLAQEANVVPKVWLAIWRTLLNVGPGNGYDWRRYTLLTAGPAAGSWTRGAVHRELFELYTFINTRLCLFTIMPYITFICVLYFSLLCHILI